MTLSTPYVKPHLVRSIKIFNNQDYRSYEVLEECCMLRQRHVYKHNADLILISL